MLWSEQLSPSLISQLLTFLSSRLCDNCYVHVALRLRLWIVVISLSSFMMCRSLLFKDFSSVLFVEFVWLSCYTVDLELLSMAIRVPKVLLNCSISSKFAAFICKFLQLCRGICLLRRSLNSYISVLGLCLIYRLIV